MVALGAHSVKSICKLLLMPGGVGRERLLLCFIQLIQVSTHVDVCAHPTLYRLNVVHHTHMELYKLEVTTYL